jgi:ribonucleoside-diphosphate reductase alpha chain
MFAVSYVRMIDDLAVREVNAIFEETARKEGFYTDELMDKISEGGSLRAIEVVPESVRRVFGTALDISPEWHVRMQAAFQRHCDNAVSKTVNLPENATAEDVRKVFALAYELGCKGITVFRYASRKQQVLSIGACTSTHDGKSHFTVRADYAGNCMTEYCTV